MPLTDKKLEARVRYALSDVLTRYIYRTPDGRVSNYFVDSATERVLAEFEAFLINKPLEFKTENCSCGGLAYETPVHGETYVQCRDCGRSWRAERHSTPTDGLVPHTSHVGDGR